MSSKVPASAPGLWLVLSRCYRALSHIAERSIEETGLCLSDFAALEALLHKGPLTITEIQAKVLLASGSMTAAIDRDNFESTLFNFAPRIELTLGNGQLADAELSFRSLDDFEPDTLYRQNDLFAGFRDHPGQPLYSEPEEDEPLEVPAPDKGKPSSKS